MAGACSQPGALRREDTWRQPTQVTACFCSTTRGRGKNMQEMEENPRLNSIGNRQVVEDIKFD